MLRLTIYLSAIALGAVLSAGTLSAQPGMKPTAPKKMMRPAEEARLQVCQQKAAQQQVKMDERAKFIMVCMKEMAK